MNSKTNKTKIPELLAPAGNLACALTAFDCGADAVYAGLGKFNARERAENFSLEEMSRLSAYSKKTGRKLYITFNTLVKESELPEAFEQLKAISKLEPDALIVQDIGIVRMTREYFPDLPLHASTQMAIHNSAGVSFAKKIGIERVILERQMTMEEIKQVASKSEVELEVFIHGALCCCLSGSCLFSSWLGGWSGNRGKCKQPCRRRYFGKDGNGFFFSTQDLYSLESVETFKELGIASLKIEGRLRKPDYVKNVVTAYRLLLDAPKGEEQKYLSEARKILSSSLGRKWSDGFRSKNSLKTLIQHESMGVSGLLCGTVKRLKKNGFFVEASKRLHVGDSVRIQPSSGDEGPAVTITKMTVDGRSAKKALKDQECFIFCDKEMPMGKVFKIGESYDEMSSRIEKLPLLKDSLDVDIRIDKNGFDINGWSKEMPIQAAEKRPLETGTVAQEFTASRSDIFRAGKINVSIKGNLFLPASILKETRREFWEWAEKNIKKENRTERLQIAPAPQKTKAPDVCAGKNNKGKCLKAANIFSYAGKPDEIILPPFCPQNELKNLKNRIDECMKNGIRRFRVTSLYAIELLRECKKLTLTGSYPLPAANSFAAKELSENGVEIVQAWIELEKSELENLTKNSQSPVEIYRYGRPSILSTRAEIPSNGMVKDARGNAFDIKRDGTFGITHVYPEKVLSLPEIKGASSFFDMTHAREKEKAVSSFNFEYELM